MKKFVSLIAIVIAFYSYSSKADNYLPIILKAEGSAVISNQPARTNAQKTLFAIKSAKRDAHNKLLNQVKSIQIDTNNTIKDLIVNKYIVRPHIESILIERRILRRVLDEAKTEINENDDFAFFKIVVEIDETMISKLKDIIKKFS